MKKTILILCILALASISAFAQTASATIAAAPDKKPVEDKATKPDLLALLPAETAAVNAIVADFNKWGARLTEAHTALEQTESATSREIEHLKLLDAAKDIRTALGNLRRAREEFQRWESDVKKRAGCDDCRFDEAQRRLVKPTPAK